MHSFNFALLHYPLTLHTVILPAGPFRFFQPEPAMVATIFRQQQEENAAEPLPYWARLWPSAIALATFIQNNPLFVAEKRIAELAAGVSLPSLVAAAYARQVWCSDISAEAMQAATQSASLNHLSNIYFEACNWNNLPEDFNAEVVLLSDINYEPSVFEELKNVLTGLLRKGCTLLLATPQRLMAKPFMEALLPFTVSQTVEVAKENGHLTYISIFTLKIN